MSKPSVFPAPLSKTESEEGAVFAPRFDADGLLPVVATSAATGEVLMFAYMNAEALARTIETSEAHYWSRSRGRLWRKGEESGNTQRVVEMRIDCDQDAHLAEGRAARQGRRLPYRAQELLLPGGAAGRSRRRRCVAALRRRRATVRSTGRLPSCWCRKGNLKEFGVI